MTNPNSWKRTLMCRSVNQNTYIKCTGNEKSKPQNIYIYICTYAPQSVGIVKNRFMFDILTAVDS